jgi:hypothetical protein
VTVGLNIALTASEGNQQTKTEDLWTSFRLEIEIEIIRKSTV